ncbi:MAG: tail fiber assembly protein [Rouxiella aceris]|uniref:tail fiber assembly protein n=1 Tax=Rouxiella aceris TaxID=2703884 RepID=UPI00283E88E8|nr:tail fiber assembly protein [Rouxiella aceris]MDR3434019.1 tail fiber assembly protein [Rouxiella aceris]
MRFSETTQAFYDDAYEHNALVNDIPSDVTVISEEQYRDFFTAINHARRVYVMGDDFHISEQRPDSYHTWNESRKQWGLTDEGKNQQNAGKIVSANQMKSQLLTSAQAIISEWQSELLLGVISDDDKARLITWLTYIKKLKAVDTSMVPNIDWPVIPA